MAAGRASGGRSCKMPVRNRPLRREVGLHQAPQVVGDGMSRHAEHGKVRPARCAARAASSGLMHVLIGVLIQSRRGAVRWPPGPLDPVRRAEESLAELFDGDFGSFNLPARVAMWDEGLRADRPSLLRAMRILPDGTLAQLPPQQAPEDRSKRDGEPEVLIFGLAAHPREDLIVPLGEDGRVANEGDRTSTARARRPARAPAGSPRDLAPFRSGRAQVTRAVYPNRTFDLPG